MKRNLLLSTTLLLLCIVSSSYAQTKKNVKARASWKSSAMRVVNSHASKSNLILAKETDEEVKDARYRKSKGNPIIGKGSNENDILAKTKSKLEQKIPGNVPDIVFDNFVNGTPTDPSLAVGPNHVIAVFNTGYRFYDKNGNPLSDKLAATNIFSDNPCCDLTVSYDNAADRWVMSILYSSDGHVEVAVTQGPDPINDDWSVYSFPNIQDYQKISVWSDGYYMTANANQASPSTSDAVFVLDRADMLSGELFADIVAFPLPGISTPPSTNSASGGFYSPQGFNVSDGNLPATGSAPIVYLQDDAYLGVNQDHLKVWTIDVDWDNITNSTISQPTELNTTAFVSVFDGGSFSNLQQPNNGTAIDALQGTIMNQAQFRKFPTYNSAIFTFTVNVNANDGELAGIRWYELRQSGDGQPWTIYQEGTYTAPDEKHAWNGCMMMDAQGNIALGYTGMGGTTNTFVSSYYTGRYANSDLGSMTIDETLISAGTGNIPSTRYVDYAKMDIDPSNDQNFWFINEYMNNNRANVVGVFKLIPNTTTNAGIVNIDLPTEGVFSNAEPISVSIFNFGSQSISNFDVSYQINGGALITETYTGTIEPTTTAEYTFAQTADLSNDGQNYTVVSSTILTGDEDNTNDSFTTTATNLFNNDIGVSNISSPVNNGQTGDQSVTIIIENFGGAPQSNFEVTYTINGGTPVTETVPGPLASLSTMSYTFTQTANFGTQGSYEVVASSSLPNDANSNNDSVTSTIDIIPCLTETNTTPQTIATTSNVTVTSSIDITDDFLIENLFVTVNIIHSYTDDITISLTGPDGTQVDLSSNNGGQFANYANTLFDDGAENSITTGLAPFTGSFQPEGNLSDFYGLSSAGTWTLTIFDGANGDGGELTNWSLSLCDDVRLSVGDKFEENNELLVLDKGDNQFDISFISTEITQRLMLNVYNMLGQKLLSHSLDNKNGRYDYDLNMSYAPKGVYIIDITDGSRSAIGRLIKR